MFPANCVRGNGRFYQGQANSTKDGLACQTWFSHTPHPETTPEGVFPEMTGAGNRCRNPGGSEPAPWCYTTDPVVRWQFCDVPPCGELLFMHFSCFRTCTYDSTVHASKRSLMPLPAC